MPRHPAVRSTWMKLLEDFVSDIRIKSKEVATTDPRGAPLVLWDSQRRFLSEVGSGLDQGVHVFNCAKSRQLGITTISLAIDVFWLAMHDNMIGCLVTDTEKNRDANRDLIVSYVESFPDGYFGSDFRITVSNRKQLSFSNGCRLDLLVAGTKKKSTAWGEGQGYAFAHMCAAPGTPVLVADGRVKAIEDVQIGDEVLTHTGAATRVIDVFGQPNTKGAMRRITPWLGSPVTCTLDHTIPTQRGVIEAKDLRSDDLLIMPVRAVTPAKTGTVLPSTLKVAHSETDREGWVRVESAGSEAAVCFTEEFGFAIGYYLAEGSILRNRDTRPSGITFARHRSEIAYADRAIAALAPFTTGHRKTVDRKDCLTSTDTVYGTSLAVWVADTFGTVDGKHIPDEVFSWGVDFCRGLLAGLLCGDGSKTSLLCKNRERVHKDTVSVKGKKIGAPRKGLTEPDKRYVLNTMVLPTTRASIAMQARDLAASLGFGWGSCFYQEGAMRHGRLCKPQWRVIWNGAAAARLRELIGLSAEQSSDRGERSKYKIENGLVYLKIRKIEDGIEEPYMWDLSVEHDDHTFRTPWMSIGNTEVASYADAEGLKSLEEGFAQQNPHRLFIFESTSKGFNHWRTRWMAGLENRETQRSFFIGWWASDTNRIEKSDSRYVKFNYSVAREEKELMQAVAQLYGHKITAEQLAWIRWKQSNAGQEQDLLDQNQPFTAEQSFVQTGYSFFQVRVISSDIKRIKDSPGEHRYQGYRYEVDGDFYSFSMQHLPPREENKHLVELKVWDEPVEGGRYVIGFDPAFGRNEHKDGHALCVFRCFADRMVQVAEYMTADVETKHAAWVLFHLCAAYGDVMANVELGGPGRLVMSEFDHLRQLLNAEMNQARTKARGWEDAAANARWYLYHKVDSPGSGYLHNFEMSWKTKDLLLHGLRGAYMSREIHVMSLKMLQEMANVVVTDGIIGAPESTDVDKKDDRVFALALANWAWQEWVRKDMLAQGMTYDIVMANENSGATKAEKGINSIVYRFLAGANVEPEEERGPEWMIKRGLL